MSQKRKDNAAFDRGTVVVWGENGLEILPASSANPFEPAGPSPTGSYETESDSRAQGCSKPKIKADNETLFDNPFGFDDEVEEGYARVQTDEDFDVCNDQETLEKRKAARKTRQKLRPRLSLFARATAALSRRDYSKKELAQKLRRGLYEDESPDEVDDVLNKLETLGYLSDARFAEGRARVRASNLGDARIRRELRQHGVGEDEVKAAMQSIEEPEAVRAYRVWLRRFKECPKDRKEREKQIRYLLYRGFSMSAASDVIRGRVELPEEEPSIWR